MELLDSMKLLTKETNTELLTLLLEQAKREIVEYCRIPAYKTELDAITLDLAVIRYNRLGHEGVSSASVSGISESYETSIPEAIANRLNRYRRVVMR